MNLALGPSRCDNHMVLSAHRTVLVLRRKNLDPAVISAPILPEGHQVFGFSSAGTSVGLPVVTKHLDLGAQGFPLVFPSRAEDASCLCKPQQSQLPLSLNQ